MVFIHVVRVQCPPKLEILIFNNLLHFSLTVTLNHLLPFQSPFIIQPSLILTPCCSRFPGSISLDLKVHWYP
jgi:hypothetical protein